MDLDYHCETVVQNIQMYQKELKKLLLRTLFENACNDIVTIVFEYIYVCFSPFRSYMIPRIVAYFSPLIVDATFYHNFIIDSPLCYKSVDDLSLTLKLSREGSIRCLLFQTMMNGKLAIEVTTTCMKEGENLWVRLVIYPEINLNFDLEGKKPGFQLVKKGPMDSDLRMVMLHWCNMIGFPLIRLLQSTNREFSADTNLLNKTASFWRFHDGKNGFRHNLVPASMYQIVD